MTKFYFLVFNIFQKFFCYSQNGLNLNSENHISEWFIVDLYRYKLPDKGFCFEPFTINPITNICPQRKFHKINSLFVLIITQSIALKLLIL